MACYKALMALAFQASTYDSTAREVHENPLQKMTRYINYRRLNIFSVTVLHDLHHKYSKGKFASARPISPHIDFIHHQTCCGEWARYVILCCSHMSIFEPMDCQEENKPFLARTKVSRIFRCQFASIATCVDAYH